MDIQPVEPQPVSPIPTQPIAPIPTQQITFQPVMKKSNKNKFVACGCFLVIFFLCFGVLALGVLGYTSNQNIPVVSDIVESVERTIVSDKQIAEMITSSIASQLDTLENQNLTTLEYDLPYKSIEYDLNFNAIINLETSDEPVSINVDGVGAWDSNSTTPKSSLDLTSEFKVEGLSLSPKLGIMVFGDQSDLVIYGKIDQLPTTILPTAREFNNKWIEFDLNKILNQMGFDNYDEFLTASSSTSSELKAGDIKKLKQLIQNEVIERNIKRLPDEVIDGVRTNCISLDLDNTDIKDYIEILDDVQGRSSSTSISTEGQFNKVEITSCVGRKDQYLYKLGFVFDFEIPNSGSAVIKSSLNIKNYNKVIKIDEPKAELDYTDLLMGISGSLNLPLNTLSY